MKSLLTLLLVLVLSLMDLHSVSSVNQGVLHRSLQISRSRLSSGARRNDSVNIPLLPPDLWRFPCSKACSQFEWCNLWCPESCSPTITTCLLFQMYVSFGYQETKTEDAILCYTTNVKDYVLGASIKASQVHPSKKERKPSNLIDGIHDFGNIHQCFSSAGHFNPYLKLDFGSTKRIRHVMFLLQNNNYARYYTDFKIIVGTEDYREDKFSKYRLVGFFPGPSSPSLEVSFSYPIPVIARYIVLQRMSHSSYNPEGSSLDANCNLQVCHIEIR